jgi:hypothetical protein
MTGAPARINHPSYTSSCMDLCRARARYSEVTICARVNNHNKPSGMGGRHRMVSLNTAETYGRFGRSEYRGSLSPSSSWSISSCAISKTRGWNTIARVEFQSTTEGYLAVSECGTILAVQRSHRVDTSDAHRSTEVMDRALVDPVRFQVTQPLQACGSDTRWVRTS